MRLNNKSFENRPKIKLKLTAGDRVVEAFGIIFLIILIALPIIYQKDLPDRVPIHFNAAGQPDDYGNRSSMWILPVTGASMYLLLTILSFFPRIYNFPVKITPENAIIQYRLATRLLRVLKTVLLMMFSFLSYQTIQTARGGAAGLGKSFLPIFLIITFGVVIFYLVQSLNRQHDS
jgi:uncharacterized membrane protein